MLAAVCGRWPSGHGNGIAPERVIVTGARDIDAAEADLMHDAGVRVFAPDACEPASIIAQIGKSAVWVHIDWDALEPGIVPAAYAVPDGLMPELLEAILHRIPIEQIVGVEIAEYELPGDRKAAERPLVKVQAILCPLLTRLAQN